MIYLFLGLFFVSSVYGMEGEIVIDIPEDYENALPVSQVLAARGLSTALEEKADNAIDDFGYSFVNDAVKAVYLKCKSFEKKEIKKEVADYFNTFVHFDDYEDEYKALKKVTYTRIINKYSQEFNSTGAFFRRLKNTIFDR